MIRSNVQEQFNLKALLLLSLGHMVTDINQGGLPILLPFLKDAFGLSYAAAGALIMTSNLTSSIVQPVFGYFTDRWGAIWLLPTGVLMACFGFSLVGFSPNYPFLLIAVLMSGLGVAAYHPEGFKTARFFTGDKKATGMAVFAVGGSLGFSVAPMFVIAAYTWLGLKGTALSALPGVVTGVLLLASLPWLSAPQRMRSETTSRTGAAGMIPIRKRWVPLTLLISAVTVRSWVQMGMMTFLPFYFVNVLKSDPVMVGKLLTVFLVSGAVGTLLGAPVADRIGHKKFFVLGMIPLAPLLWLFLQLEGWPALALIGLIGFVLVSNFSVTIVMAQQILPDRLGMASGLMVGFAIGTGGIGATILGSVADHWGVMRVLEIVACLPVLGVIFAALIPYPQDQEAVSR
jgi:MFS transporter, FSR family, fosmidomycin resistance protein